MHLYRSIIRPNEQRETHPNQQKGLLARSMSLTVGPTLRRETYQRKPGLRFFRSMSLNPGRNLQKETSKSKPETPSPNLQKEAFLSKQQHRWLSRSTSMTPPSNLIEETHQSKPGLHLFRSRSMVPPRTPALKETHPQRVYNKAGRLHRTMSNLEHGKSVDDYRKQVDPYDDVFDNDTPESKQNAMMSSWVLFRKKLNSELIRKLLDPRRVGRCEPTRVYTIDQGTSKFAIFNAKRDRTLQHARALYLHPDTYVSMGIPRVRPSSVRDTLKRVSQDRGDQVDGAKENGGVSLRRQISSGDSDYYSTRDEYGFLFRGEMTKRSAVQTFRPRSKSMMSSTSKEDETKRSTESIQLAVDFT